MLKQSGTGALQPPPLGTGGSSTLQEGVAAESKGAGAGGIGEEGVEVV